MMSDSRMSPACFATDFTRVRVGTGRRVVVGAVVGGGPVNVVMV
jgi:hypothetical protein